MSVEDVLERLQLYAKDHPMDITASDINDRKQALDQLYKLLLDEAGYMVAVGDADGEVKEGRTYYTFDVQQAVPLTAINRLFNKSNGDNTK